MSYVRFLFEWYNWPFLAAILGVVASFLPSEALDRTGRALGRWFGIRRLGGRHILRLFLLMFGVVGLTINGALHDYWPAAQERGFLASLPAAVLFAALATRLLGRFWQRHFPEIKAVTWGGPGLGGRTGRVVSRVISPDYRAGRVQVMDEDQTLHVVLCKTRSGEIAYGALVALDEYDPEDRRYYVSRVDGAEAEPDRAAGGSAGDQGA